MRTKLIAFCTAAALMFALPVVFTNAKNNAAHIIDYTTGDTIIPVTGEKAAAAAETAMAAAAAETAMAVAADITMPEIISVYDAARDITFEIDTEEYLIGVVAAEMPSDFGEEALKAQAVAARSYMLYKLMYNPSTHKGGASVCTDHTCCKAYISYEDAVLRWSEKAAAEVFGKIRAAIEPVRGVIMTYDGSVVCALFHASSSGSTESAVNVWGGDLSYLRSVDTPETEEPVTAQFTEDEFYSRLLDAGYNTSAGDKVEVSLNDTGRVDHIIVGDVTVTGVEIRSIFGLRSTFFTFEESESGYVFTCYGYGHGVGMSQCGADTLADQGYTYDEILRHYYNGVTLCTVSSEYRPDKAQ
jgi:stage II sporulation protein D